VNRPVRASSVDLLQPGVRRRPGFWSLLAFALAAAGMVAAVVFIDASNDDVVDWIWAPLMAPLVITIAPVLFPRRRYVLGGAALALVGSMMLSGWVLPMFYLPALVASVIALAREQE
jgi:hypothetical protein